MGIFSPLPLPLLGYHDPSLPCHNGQNLWNSEPQEGFSLKLCFLRYFVIVRRSCGGYRKRREERMAESSEEEGATELANMLSQLRARVYVS